MGQPFLEAAEAIRNIIREKGRQGKQLRLIRKRGSPLFSGGGSGTPLAASRTSMTESVKGRFYFFL